ncbi:unnamed protein product [Penicillium nalgiovense]|uniref:Zn(2)-C6 fungal-type domain-containing protein n=1 Tax=Penicillium nalgiovense TaxID=60175 RepID=A0A1V6YEA1_PENNA|nr:hypothetical protein PENNAL_c0023G09859 [Penicillium nalgiovense]CAG7946062.1 unnamed protein product [Penicillium nalgiovense]CAG7949622.1 unnamed protein product [Penicillium nalgiovense]CAG7978106.1 unnamed protein product [Penicillium nalgiovense]CAG7984529.1 unnamed protein product [Penicillium nalgiovense]
MPLRRSHTKSRRGCLECKRRHVKCDEGTPRCTLCKKRKLECRYPPPSEDEDSPLASSSTQDETESGAVTPSRDFSQATRLLETRLFHQYMTSTYHTLSQDGLSAHHLSMTIPHMATSCPYLLDSIHAFSALHLASVETDNRASWLDHAARYQSQACAGLSKVLPEMSPQDYEPAFVSSIIIMLFAIGSRVLSTENRPLDPLLVVLEARTLISGPAMLFSRINEGGIDAQLDGWLCVSDTEEVLETRKHDWYGTLSLRLLSEGSMITRNSGGSPVEDTHVLFNLHKDIMTSLARLHSIIDTSKGSDQPIYFATWQQLQQAIKPWPKIGPHGGPLGWPLFLSDKFSSLLQNGDWIARVLFLHYGIAMRLLCHRWYVRDWGRRLVSATLEQLDEIPPEWEETISWIRRAAARED